MPLFIVSSDWRFKDRFKRHFSYDFIHEFCMVQKLFDRLSQSEEWEDVQIIADEKLGTSNQKDLVSQLERLKIQVPLILIMDKGSSEPVLPEVSFPIEILHKEHINYEELFKKLNQNTDSIKEKEAPYCMNTLIGESKCMEEVRETLKRYASQDCSIHLFGETGTGKELGAYIIHNLSCPHRKIVPVNCSLLDSQVGNSTFFGHAKGAFTDGKQEVLGLVHEADQSTLFLDEVENLSLESQANMLRLLETRQYRQYGDTELKTSKFRLVTASNKDLLKLMENKTMRNDFYYRITDTTIRFPPLREHKEDIPLLCEYFLSTYASDKRWDKQDLKILELYAWPGNVRQLFSTLKRCCIKSGTEDLVHIYPEAIA